MDQQRAYPGSNTAAYFAARGVDLSPDEAAELVRLFLRLSDLGAVDFDAPGDGAPHGGAGAGREAGPSTVAEGPTAYNMGPSDSIGGTQS
jgi:hypothetical protein